MTAFTFTSRESYVQYRTIWKERYATLSDVIRDLKFARKGTIKITALGQMERYEKVKKAHSTPYGFNPAGLAACYRNKAREMLNEPKLAKLEAQRQYLAAREATLA